MHGTVVMSEPDMEAPMEENTGIERVSPTLLLGVWPDCHFCSYQNAEA